MNDVITREDFNRAVEYLKKNGVPLAEKCPKCGKERVWLIYRFNELMCESCYAHGMERIKELGRTEERERLSDDGFPYPKVKP
jgi:hypothetical protein